MTDTAHAPLHQVGIDCIDSSDLVSSLAIAELVVRALHKQVGSLRTPPTPEFVDTGVFLVLLPAGIAAQLESKGVFSRRVFVSGVEFRIAAETA